MTIAIPQIDPDADTLTAALAYAAAGLYVGPVRHKSKSPGSVLGSAWQRLTSTDPQTIASWFAGTDHGIFIHAGRSGLVVLDVDAPEKLHPAIRRAVDELAPPYQTSRQGEPERGHYLFEMPPGRMLGNSTGTLGTGWGEVRGHNGVIIVAPSAHEDEAGLYQWQRTGAVPTLPEYVAAELPDAMPTEATATNAQVRSFLEAHTSAERPELVGIHVVGFQKRVELGESRHQSMCGPLAGAMREAAAGLVDARTAADTLEAVFTDAVTKAPTSGKQGKARDPRSARDEWRGLLAWAVPQAESADPAGTRARVAERVPSREQETAALYELAGATVPNDPNRNSADEPTAETVAADPEAEDSPGSSWAAVSLAETVAGVVAGTITRPTPTIGRRSDGQALFYRGKVNGVAGASNSGKSWTGFYSSAQELTAGRHVVYVDLEDDMAAAVARLIDLGVPAETIVERFHYVSPTEAFTYAAAEALAGLLDTVRPTLVVIDSTGESMALDGVKPNDDDDVARWFRRLPTAIARRCGAAVVVLDHVTKAEDGGLWPIGSQRKRAAIGGAQYMQVNVSPFDRTTAGYSKLVCAKDRHGNYHQKQTVALLHITPTATGVDLELRVPPETSSSGIGAWRPTAIMERVSRLLEQSAEPLSVSKIQAKAGVKKDGTLSTAIRHLVDDGHVTIGAGPRNAILHTSVSPYRQETDPRSELFRGSGDGQVEDHPQMTVRPSPSLKEGDGGTVTAPSPGDGRGTVGDGQESGPETTCVDPELCPTCGRRMGRADTEIGQCVMCRRIAAANQKARPKETP